MLVALETSRCLLTPDLHSWKLILTSRISCCLRRVVRAYCLQKLCVSKEKRITAVIQRKQNSNCLYLFTVSKILKLLFSLSRTLVISVHLRRMIRSLNRISRKRAPHISVSSLSDCYKRILCIIHKKKKMSGGINTEN